MSFAKSMFLVLLALLLLAKGFALRFPYWGLEYEDAYIYTDTANFMRFEYPWGIDRWKTKSVISGSLEFPEYSGTYGGHPETFSLVLWGLSQVTGWRHDLALIVNSALSLSALVIAAAILWRRRSSLAVVLLTAVASAPMLLVTHSSGFSEVISSICVGAFLFTSFRSFFRGEFTWTNAGVIVCAFAMAVAFKRENLALIAAYFIAAFLRPECLKNSRFWCSAFLSGSFFFAYAHGFKLLDVERNEGAAIGQATFTLTNFLQNSPHVLEALVRPDYFGAIVIWACLSGFCVRGTSAIRGYVFFLAIAVIYMIMYSAHYRSYRQTGWGEVSAFEMIRYCTNFAPCWLAMILVNPKNRLIAQSISGKVLLLTLAVTGICAAIYQQQRLSGIEERERFAPIKLALKFVSPNEPILCQNPMVARLLSTTSQTFVDFSVAGESELLRSSSQFLVVVDTERDLHRELEAFKFNRYWERIRVDGRGGFDVWRLTRIE